MSCEARTGRRALKRCRQAPRLQPSRSFDVATSVAKGGRIRSATARLPSLGITAFAQVTPSKLIGDYRALAPTLRDLGFAAVAFSYPQRARLGSSAPAWSDDSAHATRGEPEKFACYGGYKSFYMDWNYDIWRCDAWSERLCSVWDFDHVPLVRDGCTACIADCYRDSSVMLHFAVSIGDAFDRLGEGRIFDAVKALADRSNAASMGAIVGNA